MITPHMARWDRRGRQVLRDGDIVFRRGDARLAHGFFPMSRFWPTAATAPFRIPGSFRSKWMDRLCMTRLAPAWPASRSASGPSTTSVGWGSRVEAEHKARSIVAYCHQCIAEQIPFDYELVRRRQGPLLRGVTEKAFVRPASSSPTRSGWATWSALSEFPICMFGLQFASRFQLERPLTFDSLVYFPGKERHGIWSAKQLMTVVPPTFAPGYPEMSETVPPIDVLPPEGSARRTKKVSTPRQAPQPDQGQGPAPMPRESRRSHAPPGEELERSAQLPPMSSLCRPV